MLPTVLIESHDFHNAWVRAVKSLLSFGRFGKNEEGKTYKEITLIVKLSKNAIEQIKNKELSSYFPTKKEHLEEYIKQFTRSYEHDFNYTYLDRFVNEFGVDQIEIARRKIKQGVGRRTQLTTWNPNKDLFSQDPPCLQRVFFYLGNIRKGLIGVHFHWRSRDVFNAWQSNIIALVYLIKNELLDECRYEISYILDITDSAHIYYTDIELARKINFESYDFVRDRVVIL